MDDSILQAIDPRGCGCTECLIGEYRPLDAASDDDIQKLFLGEVRDNTDNWWTITQTGSTMHDGFGIYDSGRVFHVDRISLPIPVEHYTIELKADSIEAIARGADYIGP